VIMENPVFDFEGLASSPPTPTDSHPPPRPWLCLRLLGGCEFLTPEGPVRLETAKTAALLVYLVMRPGPHRRHTLMGLLWGDLPESKARRNLRRALWDLRRKLSCPQPPPFILATRQTVEFNRASDYWLDVEEFERLAGREQKESEALEQAVELYRGGFLEGFYVSDAPAFEEWMLMEKERLQTLMLLTLQRLVAWYTIKGEYEAGILHARRLLALDPWREETHRELMRLLAATGQRSAALAQYYQCRHMLHTAFGSPPDQQTELLYHRIIQECRGVMPTELLALSYPAEHTPQPPTPPPEWQGASLFALRSQLLTWLTTAAEWSWREYAHDDTLSFLSAALNLVQPDDFERRWTLLSTRERVHHFTADRAAQARDLDALEALAPHLKDASYLISLRVRQIQYACRIGEYTQALAWGKQALEQAGQLNAPNLLAHIHEVMGETYWNLGDYATARDHVEQALHHYLAEGNREGEVRARNGLGNIWRRLGQTEKAREEWERAMQLYRDQDNEWGVGMMLNNLGALAIDSEDYDTALDHHHQALAIRRRLGDRRGESSSLNNLAMTYYLMGDYEAAHKHVTAAIALAREIGERSWLVSFLETATRIELARRNYEGASRLCDEGLALSEEAGDRHNAAFYHHSAGEIALALGEAAKAATSFDRACLLRRQLNERVNLSASLAGRAMAHLALNDTAAALTDAREAVALLEQTGHAGEYAEQEVRRRVYLVERVCGDREGYLPPDDGLSPRPGGVVKASPQIQVSLS